MNKVCFASFEIYPTTPGGVGTLLFNAASVLLQEGIRVVFILDLPLNEFEKFKNEDSFLLPNRENCRFYHVDTLCKNIDLKQSDFISLYAWNSYRFHIACSKVYQNERPTLIEFFDYVGIGYYTLTAKVCGLDYKETHLAIRLHSSNEVMDINQPREINFGYYSQYNLEHYSLKLGESILFPSEKYLEHAYKINYPEYWFGNLARSTPPLTRFPKRRGTLQHQDIILFYGRLFSLKGVDKFVDSAVALLSEGEFTAYQFYLVGYDSMRPPTGAAGQSYREYLLNRIPKESQDKFHFTGSLSWEEMEALIPRVRFAVFPNYYESFCYAAHELYAAGVPLIVSDIPAFQDYFQDKQNALVFDGSVENLISCMKDLENNAAVRKRISYPYPVVNSSMNNFYQITQRSSWIKTETENTLPSLLICILDEGGNTYWLDQTVSCFKQVVPTNLQIYILKIENDKSNENSAGFPCLGKFCKILNLDGYSVTPTSIRTSDTLLLLNAGDILDPNYIDQGLQILARQPEISFVGCWRTAIDSIGQKKLLNFPLDAMLEIAPFIGCDSLNRCIMRTNPGKLFVDLLDSRSGEYGELQYLWFLDNGKQCGVIIPKVMLHQSFISSDVIPESVLAYLVMQDRKYFRKERLARFAVSLVQDQLKNFKTAFNGNGQISISYSSSPLNQDRLVVLRQKIHRWLQSNRFMRHILLKPVESIWKFIKQRKFNYTGN